jgi:hypothetical protein
MEIYRKSTEVELKQYYDINDIIDRDCDLYDADTDELIFSFKKNVIPKELYDIDPKVIKYSQTYSSNRADASGVTNIKDLQKGMTTWKNHPIEVVDKHGNALPEDHNEVTSWIRMKDGSICKRKRSNQAMSNSVGGFDKSNVFPCRLTNWTRNHLKAYESVFDLCLAVSDLYYSYVPDKWCRQHEKYSKSPADFVIPNSNFSTLTINYDFRTAAHKDKGDCKEGMTCFCVKELDTFEGGELCFPDYNIGINIREGDLLIFNPHHTHCNNPLTKGGRMSFVFYLREKMSSCPNVNLKE